MDPGPNDPKKSRPYNSYLKYGNLTAQLFAAIGLAAWGGYKLDKYLGFKFPVFLLSFVLIVFSGMILQIYRSINKD